MIINGYPDDEDKMDTGAEMNRNHTRLRLSIGAALSLIIFLLFLPLTNGNSFQHASAAPAPSPTPLVIPDAVSLKIDPQVVASFQAHPSEKVSVIIYMTEKTDLSEPNFAKTSDSLLEIKAQRDQVYQALTTTAQESQSSLLDFLKGPVKSKSLSSTPILSFWIFNGIAATLDYQTVLEVAGRDDVKHVYLDEAFEISPIERDGIDASDPLDANEYEWNISKIGVEKVWNELNITGKGVVVGIVDTGVSKDHPALASKYRGNHTYQTYSFKDFVGGELRPYDDNGHGTHVMGIILGDGGSGNRIGVAPGAEWIAAKAVDAFGSAHLRGLLWGLQWIMAPEGVPSLSPDIVNSSWSTSCTSDYFYDVVKAVRSAGIIPVFSAGNAGPNPETVRQPACFPGAIAVGATDIDDKIAEWSSRGPSFNVIKPDFSAPGVNIRSSVNEFLYQSHSGTSMAAPMVSGVIALMLEANPSIALDRIVSTLADTAVDLGPSGADNDYGWGRIDAYRAVSGGEAPVGDVRLISPNGVIPDKLPTYKWEAVANAQNYQLKVTDADGNQILAAWYKPSTICDGSLCSVQPSKSLQQGNYAWQVQVDTGATSQPWSKPLSFMISEGLPGQATLNSPSGQIQETSPVYKWGAVASAEKYQIKVDDAAGTEIFSAWYDTENICIEDLCQVKTTSELKAGDYTWKVLASNTAGNGSWSDGMSFKVELPVPGAATLSSPKGLIKDTSPTYEWKGVNGAIKYQLSVKDQSGKEVISSWYQTSDICNESACLVKTTTSLTFGTFTWQVMASNAMGDGPWSESLTFQVGEDAPGAPILISPSESSAPIPEFKWKTSGNASEYKLRLRKASGESISAVWYQASDVCANGECTVKSNNVLEPGSYQWDVQANGESGLSPWSAVLTFTVKASEPSKVVLVSPSGETLETKPLFVWKGVENVQSYQIKVATLSDKAVFTDTYLAAEVCKAKECSLEIDTALPEGEYQWQILATYADGSAIWSEAIRFKISTPAPSATELITPRGEVSESQPVFRWKTILGSSEYRLKISNTSGDIVRTWYKAEDICSEEECAVKAAVILDGGDYTWQVQTSSAACGGPWSDTAAFRVKESAPGLATLFVPAGKVSETQPTFRWSEVHKATEYELRILNGDGKSVYDKWFRSADFCANGTCTAKISTVLASGAYSWQVLASNQVSDGPWSSPTQFTVMQLPPGGPVTRKPNGNITEKQPIFEWQAVGGATEYQINVTRPSGRTVLSGWYKAASICTNEICTVRAASEIELGTYSWRVRSGNKAGVGAWGAGGSFTVSAAPLGAATLTSPDGGVENEKPAFTWYFMPGVTHYQIKVVGPAGGTQNVFQAKLAADDVCSGATCSTVLPNRLPKGKYAWQVLTFSESGIGAWSKTLNFTVSGKLSSTLPSAEDEQPAAVHTAQPQVPLAIDVPKHEIYIVQEGDALNYLAAQWGITLQELAGLNQISYPYVIYPGQELKRQIQIATFDLMPKDMPESAPTFTPTMVPTESETPAPLDMPAAAAMSGEEYTVQTGDYLLKLARDWGVLWKDVVDVNDLDYPYILTPGQTLKIP